MTALYVPAMAPDGTCISMTGIQVAVVLPPTLVAETTACGELFRVVLGTKLKVAGPVVCVRALMI